MQIQGVDILAEVGLLLWQREPQLGRAGEEGGGQVIICPSQASLWPAAMILPLPQTTAQMLPSAC